MLSAVRSLYIVILTVAAAVAVAAQGAPAVQAPAPAPALEPQTVRAIAPSSRPLPDERDTAKLSTFSFIVYGDTRGGPTDGVSLHPVHTRIMDRILATVEARRGTDRAIAFVLQTGDAVLRGSNGRMWNVSYSPIIERLTQGAGVPYFLTAGNHDVIAARDPGEVPGRQNTQQAMVNLLPPVGSPRRLGDTLTFAFGYGHVFVLAIDSNVPDDAAQLAWATAQLEGLDRTRFTHVFAFMHYPPYSSGPHGGPTLIEPQTATVRATWMPLFRTHHVRMVLAGHEHFYEHWVERYEDGGRPYRMDTIITGGGGAPVYSYRGEPDLTEYQAQGAAQRVRVEHLVKPAPTIAENQNHFVIIDVDGDRLQAEVVGVGDTPYAPFDGERTKALND